MSEEQNRLAAHNNAVWCDAVYRAHGRPGEFRPGLWCQPGPSLPFYPNLVTLGQEDAAGQLAAIRELDGLGLGAGWGVKDSFCALDLAPLGFDLLFTATWIWRAADLPTRPQPGVEWRQVATDDELDAWERAWSAPNDDGEGFRLFPPSLLEDRAIAFLAGYREGRLAGGAIANRSGAVVGLSNIFAPASEAGDWWDGCVAATAAAFPGLPIVGYEQAESLPLAAAAGFAALAPLQVWLRGNQQDERNTSRNPE